MTNYRNGPQRTTMKADWGHNGLQQRWSELPGTTTQTDWSARNCHEMQGKWSQL